MKTIDVNTYVGHWPFRRIQPPGARGLLSIMDQTETEVALATPMHSIFYKDCLEGLKEMLEEIGEDRSRLWPLAVINPAFPGWEEDFAISIDELGALGLRLFPNYHGYDLNDACARDLLREAETRDLPVMISFRIRDERSHHWLVQVPPVPVEGVDRTLRAFPDLKVILGNALWNELDALDEHLTDRASTFAEMSHFKGPMFIVEQFVDRFGAERLLYGSAAPLHYPEAQWLRVTRAEISDEEKGKILGGNAAALFGTDTD